MKILDAIRLVKKDNPQYCFDSLADDLGVYGYIDFDDQSRLVSYPIKVWYCTDQHVGMYAIYFDGEPVGYSYQSARKNSEEYNWTSSDAAKRVRDYIFSLNRDDSKFNIIDGDDELEEEFAVCGESRLSDDGFYQGNPATALVYYTWCNQTTPVKYRRVGKAYFVRAEWDSPLKDQVVISCQGEEITVNISEFVQRINVEI